MIGVDWGTTRCRAYRMHNRVLIDRRDSDAGTLALAPSDFPAALRRLVDSWLSDGEDRVLLAGMVGSRQGWVEAPYVPCPVSLPLLAQSVIAVPFSGASARLVPGVAGHDATGAPEFMRGEEAQIFGTDITTGIICLPGSHSKWVAVTDGRIVEFSTHLTGEAYAALRQHTILARSMRGASVDLTAFDAGVARSGESGGVLHHLFGVRALALADRLGEAAGESYLSGLLIGHEVRAALGPPPAAVHVIAATHLADLYARALRACGATVHAWPDDTAALGLCRIAEAASWS